MRILLVRTSAMGDVVHCLPVLTAIRRAFPDAEVGWVVEKVWSRLLEGHPDVDRLFRVRTKAWRRQSPLRSLPEVWRAIREMRAFRADVALDLMGNHKGALLARLSGARRTIGAGRRDRREPSSAVWLGEKVPCPGPHAVDVALGVVRALGVEPAPVRFGGDRLLPSDESVGDALAELDPSRPLVLVQAGAGWANKTWPADWWGEVASSLRSEVDAEVRVLLAPGEEELAGRVVAASDGAARLLDTRDFRVLAAACRRASLLVGGDTGPVHLAHALGTPVLCLVGPTDPRRNGPYGDPDGIVFRELPCSYCYRRFDEPKACLVQYSPGEIVRRALSRLASTDRRPTRREDV